MALTYDTKYVQYKNIDDQNIQYFLFYLASFYLLRPQSLLVQSTSIIETYTKNNTQRKLYQQVILNLVQTFSAPDFKFTQNLCFKSYFAIDKTQT